MQSRPLILGYVCEAGGLRGAVLCRAAAGKQPRTDTPAGPEAEMCLPSPWCCIQGWWGVCFVQLCGIRQPDDSAQMQAGRWRAPTWSSGRARRWGPRALRGRPSPQIEHGYVCFALQWNGLHQQAAAGCRIRHMPDDRWQMAAALATAGGRLVGGPERPQKPFITKARHSTPKPTAES